MDTKTEARIVALEKKVSEVDYNYGNLFMMFCFVTFLLGTVMCRERRHAK